MNINSADIEQYLERHGSRGAAELNTLYRNIVALENIFETEIGRSILADDINRCMALMNKSYKEDLDIDEKAELRYLKKRLEKLADKMATKAKLEKTILEKLGKT